MRIWNKDIRNTAKESNVKLWEIADRMNIADCQLSRKLRKELPAKEKEYIFSIIKDLESDESRKECVV